MNLGNAEYRDALLQSNYNTIDNHIIILDQVVTINTKFSRFTMKLEWRLQVDHF